MRRKLTLLMMIAIFLVSGCNNTDSIKLLQDTLVESNEASKATIMELIDKSSKLEDHISKLEDNITELIEKVSAVENQLKVVEDELIQKINTGYSVPLLQAKNVVVDSPSFGAVTFEIDKRMVGKYIVEDDPDMYFEIKPDGRAEISLNALEGYAKYYPIDILLTIYYQRNVRVYVCFNLISGEYTLPASCGLSVIFLGDPSYTSFVSTNYWSDYRMKFIKQ